MGLKRLQEKNKDLLIVDQTNGYLSGLGLYCVKAIFVDGIPIDFTSEFIREKDHAGCKNIKDKKIYIH